MANINSLIAVLAILGVLSSSIAMGAETPRQIHGTKGEICAGMFMALGDLQRPLSTDEINLFSSEAIVAVRNFRIQTLPRTDTWSFDEVLLSHRSKDEGALKTAAERLNGLDRVYVNSLVPDRASLNYASDGIVLKGAEAIEDFFKSVNSQAQAAEVYRQKFLNSFEARARDLAINGFVSLASLSYLSHHGDFSMPTMAAMLLTGTYFLFTNYNKAWTTPVLHYRVKKAEKYHKLYISFIKNIRYAEKNNLIDSWFYWGVNEAVPKDYLNALMDARKLHDAYNLTAKIELPVSPIDKSQNLEDAADVSFDYLFKFEGQVPTLTIFLRYAAPQARPPAPPKKKEKEVPPQVELQPARIQIK